MSCVRFKHGFVNRGIVWRASVLDVINFRLALVITPSRSCSEVVVCPTCCWTTTFMLRVADCVLVDAQPLLVQSTSLRANSAGRLCSCSLSWLTLSVRYMEEFTYEKDGSLDGSAGILLRRGSTFLPVTLL